MNETSSLTQAIPASGEAVLSIRLWASEARIGSGESSRKGTGPASLVADLVEASGGTGLVADADLLVSKFSNLPTAILAARRIQWAVAGYAESRHAKSGNSEFGNTGSPAILIQSAEDGSKHSASSKRSLQDASPGQILLAEGACQSLENLPGLSFLPSSAGLRELQWRISDYDQLTDEEALKQLIRQHGLEDTVPAEPERPVLPPAAAETAGPIEQDVRGWVPIAEPVDEEDRDWLLRLRQMPLWIKVASGVVPLGVAAVIFTVLFHAKAPAHAPDQPASSVVQPPSQPGPSAVESTVDRATTAKPVEAAKQTHQGKTPAPLKPVDPHRPAHPVPDTPKPTSACTLNPNDIASALSIADARFQNRQYKEAERRYRSVLACQPENSHAANGAERARAALQLQSSNP